MNKQILFKSALSLVAAVAAGSAFAAATSVLDVDFESFSADYAITNADYWAADGADESKVAGDSSNKYLDLKTEGSTLTRTLDQASTLNTALSDGTLTVDNPAVFSAEVKFVPSDTADCGLAGGTDDTKFALYAYAPDGGNTTNLVVFHAYMDGGVQYTNEVIDVNGALDDPEAFTKVSVKVFPAPTAADGMFFTIDLNGNPLSTAIVDDLNEPFEGGTIGVDYYPMTWFKTVNGTVDDQDKFSAICFKGTGAVDDLKVDLGEDAVDSWTTRLGAAVDGAYLIDNLAELESFQAGVAAGLPTANTTFKLNGNITLTSAWPGIGIQNGKDIYSTPEFNEGAFCGVFDGQNYTISGFQMQGGGLDYCGFFNSTYGATIQNLKIAYAGSLFAADTTASTKESGATFVGVAKNSTLDNLTTVAGTVSCSKGFGGIVGYLTSGSTVQNCTNNLNMTSLAGNKCGGIAMITQGGSAVTISNCQNNGTQTTTSSNSEYGAIVGYVGLDITITDCETTVGRFLKHQGNTVTLQGVNKGDPTVPAYHGAATPGLNFATVDGNVATFVADTAITTGNTYKVLGPSATATYEFAAAGSISFDTNLIQTVTFAITAAEGLTLTDATENGVVTYTAAAAAPAGFDGGDGVTTFSIAAATQTALEGNLPSGATLATVADAGTGLTYAQAYALGLWDENATEVAPLNAEITFDAQGQPKVELDATAGAAYDVTCKLYGSTSLPVATTGTPIATAGLGTALVDTTASSATAKFYKVVVVISDKQ